MTYQSCVINDPYIPTGKWPRWPLLFILVYQVHVHSISNRENTCYMHKKRLVAILIRECREKKVKVLTWYRTWKSQNGRSYKLQLRCRLLLTWPLLCNSAAMDSANSWLTFKINDLTYMDFKTNNLVGNLCAFTYMYNVHTDESWLMKITIIWWYVQNNSLKHISYTDNETYSILENNLIEPSEIGMNNKLSSTNRFITKSYKMI